MPYAYTKKPMYKKRSYKPRKTIRKAVKTAVRTNFNKKVLRVIKRHEETKISAPYVVSSESIVPQDGGTNVMTLFDLTKMWLAIDQGTGQGDRIGNKIYPVSNTIKGSINIDYNESTFTRPILVKMFIFKDKKNLVSNSAGDLIDIMQLGDTNSPPVNLPMDIVRLFNKDRYIIYATRVFKLGLSASTNGNNNNNDFSTQKFFSINLTKDFKVIQYNDDVEPDSVELVKPNNLWMGFLVSYADGTTITFGEPNNLPQLEISFDAVTRYKDA